MQPKFVCSKCGQRGFRTINDLETHIVKDHFSNVNSLYKCWFSGCSERFATEFDRLKHMDHKQHDGLLKMFMQMQDEGFVALRLVINNCLNESINLSFSRLYELNGNNPEGPIPIESSGMRLIGMASTALQRPAATPSERRRQTQQNFYDSNDAGKKRSTVSKLQNPILENSGMIDENNKRTELENAHMFCVVKDEPSLIDELAETVPVFLNHSDKFILGNAGSIDRSNEMIEPVASLSPFDVKDEPSLFDELAETVPVSSSDKFILGNVDSINKGNERTQPEASSKLSLVKEEPFDELAETVIVSSNRDVSMDSNDEIRSVTAQSAPNAGIKADKDTLTTLQMQAIVRANEKGTRKWAIAKIFDTSVDTVSKVLNQYRSEGTVGRKPGRGRKTCLTTQQMQAVVKANEQGTKKIDIAQMCGTSIQTVNRVLIAYRSEGTERRKSDSGGKKWLTTQQMQAMVKAHEQGTKKIDIAQMFDTSIQTIYRIVDAHRSGGTVRQQNSLTTQQMQAIVKAREQGMKTSDIAKMFHTSIYRAYRVLRAHRSKGNKIKPGGGRKRSLTVPQMQAIVKANEQGTKKSDIAKMFHTSRSTVCRFLDAYRSEGSIDKNNETIESDTSSKRAAVKDEPSLMDELASTIPVTSNSSDKLILGNADKLTPSLERRSQRLQNLTKSRTNCVTRSMAASSSISKPRMEISEPNIENKVRIEPEESSRSCVVKIGKRFIKLELAPLDPVISSNDSIDKGNERPDPETISKLPSNFDSIEKGNERVEPATSSKLSLVKEEPFDELAARIPSSSNRIDGLAVGNSVHFKVSENVPRKRKRTRTDEDRAKDAARKRYLRAKANSNVIINLDDDDDTATCSPKATVLREKATLDDSGINLDVSTIAVSSPVTSRGRYKLFKVSKNVSRKRKRTRTDEDRAKNAARNRNRRAKANSNVIINLDDDDDTATCSPKATVLREKEPSASKSAKPRMEILSEQNNELKNTEHVNSVLVKDEPSLIDELASMIPAPSNHFYNLTSSNNEPFASEKLRMEKDRNNEHKRTMNENSVVKDEPSAMEELTTTLPASSNHNGLLIPLSRESAALSQKLKRSRKQNFADLEDNRSAQSQALSSPCIRFNCNVKPSQFKPS